LAIWRIFRRSPLSEEKYPNRNPAWKQALLIIDFQGFTRKGSSTSLSGADPADVGSHVVKCNNTDTKPYIVPLCLWHNAKNECLQLTQDAVLVDPNPLDSCEKKS
jgi:hypothetical protein